MMISLSLIATNYLQSWKITEDQQLIRKIPVTLGTKAMDKLTLLP